MTKERLIELLDQGAITLIGLHESEDVLNLIASLSDEEVLARFSTKIWQEAPSTEIAEEDSQSDIKTEASESKESQAEEEVVDKLPEVTVNPAKVSRKKKAEVTEASDIVVDEA